MRRGKAADCADNYVVDGLLAGRLQGWLLGRLDGRLLGRLLGRLEGLLLGLLDGPVVVTTRPPPETVGRALVFAPAGNTRPAVNTQHAAAAVIHFILPIAQLPYEKSLSPEE